MDIGVKSKAVTKIRHPDNTAMRDCSARFVTDLHEWYPLHKRDLPWRKTTDPYQILVSEVMLQQTQVDRVVPRYELFLKSFPTVQSLAKASPARVIALWSGLGYNRRALNLLTGAKVVVETMGGEYPRRSEELVKIPGIGPYTSAAVASFAFNADTAVVDTNVIRILARIFIGIRALREPPSRNDFEKRSLEILPRGKSRTHNNAIMEFGALICKAKPDCNACFASSYCAAYQELKAGQATPNELELLGTPRGGLGTIQSRFEGSDRQIRGAIIRILKTGRQITSTTLAVSVEAAIKQTIEPQRFGKILQGLAHDGMITLKKDTISLPA